MPTIYNNINNTKRECCLRFWSMNDLHKDVLLTWQFIPMHVTKLSLIKMQCHQLHDTMFSMFIIASNQICLFWFVVIGKNCGVKFGTCSGRPFCRVTSTGSSKIAIEVDLKCIYTNLLKYSTKISSISIPGGYKLLLTHLMVLNIN